MTERCERFLYIFVLLLAFPIAGAVSAARSEPIEPSDAIASDIAATRRPTSSGGALSSSPAANAPQLGLITPQYQEIPSAWSYNPYTTGLAACPQREPGDLPCGDTVAPSYGALGHGIRY